MLETPLLTLKLQATLMAARRQSAATATCSVDLDRSVETVRLEADGWIWRERRFPYPERCKERTIYYWSDEHFEVVARYSTSLIKLVPTEWGPPTFEIDGIKMLPTAKVSPYADAERKVSLIQPRGKAVLDTCGGLGYFASWCLQQEARQVLSFEKNPDVIWLRGFNPWSPQSGGALTLLNGDVAQEIEALPDEAFDAILHDPPRFGIAGELYSQAFYNQLARVLRSKGSLFHYTGSPNRFTSGRDVPNEVARRLRAAHFHTEFNGDGVLAVKK